MKYLYQNRYWSINKDYDIDKILYLLIDRPNRIKHNTTQLIWTNDKYQTHRNYDLPAFICDFYNDKHVSLSWNKNYKSHREKSKPAYINRDAWL